MFRSFRAAAARIFGSSSPTSTPLPASVADATAWLVASGQLNIPIAETDDTAGHQVIERGRHLARQDWWGELSQEMRAADEARETTPCGQPVADLLGFGARADVVLAAEHALSDGRTQSDYDFLAGISELEGEIQNHPDDPMIALVVALAHIDLAWAWRGTADPKDLPALHQSRCAAHFDRAAVLLKDCRSAMPNSPAIAAADCALLAGHISPRTRVADKYEALITLDPQNHRHMRAMGSHLLPRRFGTYDQLEVQALRNAARTQKTWGAGGYTWVQFDAIALDDEACARVDVEYFLEGLHDIVERRPDQQTINLLAAYCSVTLQNGMGRNPKADIARKQICEAANWLIRDHLTELHPLIWAHAANGFSNSLRVNSTERFAARGRRDALRAIANQLREELRSGQSVTFTPTGLQVSGN